MNFDIDPRDINLQGPDGMQLVKLLRGLIEEIDSGGDVPVPVVDSEIFYCTYNQTSGAEISQALSNGLLPICKYNTKVYYLVSTVPPYAFVSFDRTNFNMYLLTCIGTTWSMPIRYLQERLEFDYTPTEGSTNPVTSGGVWTAIQHGGGGSDIDPYQQYPEMDGVASPGSSDDYARGNHVHPTDTSRAAASEITRIDAALAGKADQASIEQTIEDTVDEWLTGQAPSIGTLSYAAKRALLACFRKVAWIDNQGQTYYNTLERELFPDTTLESITAVFTQGSAVIYDTDSLGTLKQYLVVTATYSDSTTAIVTDYTLSGTLTEGTSTITASYDGKTDTFEVTVEKFWTFEWDYSMGKLEAQTDWSTEVGGTASSSIVNTGERFVANSSGTNYMQVFPIAGNPLKTMPDGKGTVQITFVGNIGTGSVHNFRMSTAKDETQRMQILIAQGKFRVFSNSTPSSCQAIADYANGVEYTVKIVLKQTVADIYINGVLVGDGIQASIVTAGASNYLMAQNLGSGHYIDLKSYKIRLGEA